MGLVVKGLKMILTGPGEDMGHEWVGARIAGPDGSRYVEVNALVNTGAALTVIPRNIARELELEVTGRSIVETGVGD